MEDTICHVLRPSISPSPDEVKSADKPYAAIGARSANGVIFLNARVDTHVTEPSNQVYLPQKNPIAK
jgi:hypothetical protein